METLVHRVLRVSEENLGRMESPVCKEYQEKRDPQDPQVPLGYLVTKGFQENLVTL